MKEKAVFAALLDRIPEIAHNFWKRHKQVKLHYILKVLSDNILQYSKPA